MDNTGSHDKHLGSWYTPPHLALKLSGWALRSSQDRMLDPSHGGLAFLHAAHKRLQQLGASPRTAARQLTGIDLDDQAASSAALDPLAAHATLIQDDAFAVNPDDLQVDAVIGNPPYVRFQLWGGDRARAQAACAAQGVTLTGLASLWAPFTVHACRFLKPGGRLAFVLPAEILHAQYAGPVRDFLLARFSTVAVGLFRQRVFPGAQEEVVVLIADGWQKGPAGGWRLSEVADVEALDVEALLRVQPLPASATPLEALLPTAAREAYAHCRERDDVVRASTWLQINIGLVTGANDFFVLNDADRSRWGIDALLTRPALSRAGDLPALCLSSRDLADLASAGRRVHLLTATPKSPERQLKTLAAYLEEGTKRGLPDRYKCRIRDPWWQVPGASDSPPDLLLTYIVGEHPRLAVNQAGALSTNALHAVRLRAGAPSAASLAAVFPNALTALSVELEGRSYGGGALKLEPSEAGRLLLPPPAPGAGRALRRLKGLAGNAQALREAADALSLIPAGVDPEQITALSEGAGVLRERRRARAKA